MSLLLDDDALHARRVIAIGALQPLTAGLLAELAPLLDGRVEIPREKALLSRTGGRCPHDGTLLLFDPLDPRLVCPRCGTKVSGGMHDRFRPYWMQLWIAERVLHAAVLGTLLNDERCTAAAWSVLEEYAERYLDYPNRDNVLGPSRPFFSTYLESIWLLQLVLALDLLESAAHDAPTARGGRIRDRIVEPSIQLVATYDEGLSNRQVWNNAALVAAGTLLSRRGLVDRALEGSSGLGAHLAEAVLGDGSWYEGENYHLFAHRGLWYTMTIAEQLGRPPDDALSARFDDGFVSPFRTLLPDLTYPSRRDSQYAVSVRQPRFAESCELGLARRDDPRLVGMLARLYDAEIERGDTGRRASTADVERNLPATGLARGDLSWRALLFAREELPKLETHPFESDLLPAQGFGMLRRNGGALYVGLDYGHSGGGHGHPDRLNVLLSDGDVRWFDDPGTGSYVDESLHWYRSTLAHTAPLLDGRSQPRVHGTLLAFEDRGVAGWISAHAPLAADCDVRRSVVVLHDYLVDRIEWTGGEHELALPLHGVAVMSADGEPLVADPSPIEGGVEPEDGFRYLGDTGRLPVVEQLVRLRGESRGAGGLQHLDGWIATPAGTSWWSARTLGAPGRPEQSLVLPRVRAHTGTLTAVWSWRGAVGSVNIDRDTIRVSRTDGTTDVYTPHAHAWEIVIGGGAPILLRGSSRGRADDLAPQTRAAVSTAPSPIAMPFRRDLGEAHYRRSEETWAEAGRPTATVSAHRHRDTLDITVIVPRSSRRFVPIGQENPLDNDPAAIHGDGVQLYVDAAGRSGGWLLVPIADTNDVAIRLAEGWRDELDVRATWRLSGDGYQLDARLALSPDASPLALDVLVNVSGPGRTRRRGQLVLSGARGEFVYLRADRHDQDRLLPLLTGE